MVPESLAKRLKSIGARAVAMKMGTSAGCCRLRRAVKIEHDIDARHMSW
jgi:hypothetical protein